MILYFSATGNTRYVAQRLATLLKDEALDLLDRIKRGDCPHPFGSAVRRLRADLRL